MNIKPEWLDAAKTMAAIAGDIALQYFRKSAAIKLKDDRSPVTIADALIDEALKNYVSENFPEHAYWGEETGLTEADKDYLWVIDPIDGTAAFASGKPSFTTLIALVYQDEPILGLISQPFTKECWVGIKNQGAWYNDQKIIAQAASQTMRGSCTTPAMFKTPKDLEMLAFLQSQSAIMTYGGDAYAYGLLASGFIDIIVECNLKFYDVAALVPVITESGGVITDWVSEPIYLHTFNGRIKAASATAKLPNT